MSESRAGIRKGIPMAEDIKAKISASSKGRVMSPESIEKRCATRRANALAKSN